MSHPACPARTQGRAQQSDQGHDGRADRAQYRGYRANTSRTGSRRESKVIEGTAETVALPAPDVVPDGPNKVMDAADTAVGARERKPRKRKVPSPASVIS